MAVPEVVVTRFDGITVIENDGTITFEAHMPIVPGVPAPILGGARRRFTTWMASTGPEVAMSVADQYVVLSYDATMGSEQFRRPVDGECARRQRCCLEHGLRLPR